MKKLVKVDGNGTKYYEEIIPCPRCSIGDKADGIYYTGTCNGELMPSRVNAGICFLCNGSGTYLQKSKEYTPEHAEKLRKAREMRAEKKRAEEMAKAQERNLAWLKKEGFSEDGNIWLILGDTYSIKDDLKALGCRFNGLLGWYSARELTEYPTAKMTAEELVDVDCYGKYYWASYSDVVEKCNAKRAEYKKSTAPDSQHVGNIGDKVEIRARFTAEHSFTTVFNYHHVTNWIYTFTELETGNVFVWKTTSFLWDEDDSNGHPRALETGSTVRIRGTIKAHTEYKEIKQTELTRCKIKKEETK